MSDHHQEAEGNNAKYDEWTERRTIARNDRLKKCCEELERRARARGQNCQEDALALHGSSSTHNSSWKNSSRNNNGADALAKNGGGGRNSSRRSTNRNDKDAAAAAAGQEDSDALAKDGNGNKNENAKDDKDASGKCGDKPKDTPCCCKCMNKIWNKFVNSIKPGLFHCWYCCVWWLVLILIIALALLALELFFTFRKGGPGITGKVLDLGPPLQYKKSVWVVVIFFLALIASIFLIGLIQITFFFVQNEFKSCKSIIFWIILFSLTLIACLGAIIIGFVCPTYCGLSEKIIDFDKFSYVEAMRAISILNLVLLMLVMHIYIFYTRSFREEQKELNDPECEPGRRRAGLAGNDSRTGLFAGKKVSPEEEGSKRGSRHHHHQKRVKCYDDVKVRVFYTKL